MEAQGTYANEDYMMAGSMEEQEPMSIGFVHDRKTGDKAHFCICCSFPVAIFGRLYPCLHAYCLACASDMDSCFM